jgi:hypothetical protein
MAMPRDWREAGIYGKKKVGQRSPRPYPPRIKFPHVCGPLSCPSSSQAAVQVPDHSANRFKALMARDVSLGQTSGAPFIFPEKSIGRWNLWTDTLWLDSGM